MNVNCVTVSELSAADPFFSLRNEIKSKIAMIEKQWSYCTQTRKTMAWRRDFALRAHAKKAELIYLGVQLDKPYTLNHTRISSMDELSALGSGLVAPCDALQGGLKFLRGQLRRLGTSAEIKLEVFGMQDSGQAPAPELWVQEALEEMKRGGLAARVAEAKWRICEEIELRARQGWYIVFNTLTVRNEDYDKVFAKGSLAWRNYARSIDRVIGARVHGSVRNADALRHTEPYHSYFCIVERGKEHGRLHIHVLHCFKDIPESWYGDPNSGVEVPDRRCVSRMNEFWQFGFSRPIACRFSEFDVFGWRAGWRWPVEQKKKGKYTPIEGKPPVAMGRYLCKYLIKAYESNGGKDQWRTRYSRSFGLTRLRMALSQIGAGSLQAILELEGAALLRVKEVMIPRHRLRVETLRLLLKATTNEKTAKGGSGWPTWMLRKSLMEVNPRSPIVERLRSLIRIPTRSSSPSIGNSSMQSLSETVVCDVVAVFERVFATSGVRFSNSQGVCSPSRGTGPRGNQAD